MTLIVHHLENSRSQRVLWLLEELGVTYDVKTYERDRRTMLAPPELKLVHPLGKSPIIDDKARSSSRRARSSIIWSRRRAAGSVHPRNRKLHDAIVSSSIMPRAH